MKNPIAKMYTQKGVITMELYPQQAPNTVSSFIYAAKNNMYKNRLIKRVVPGFVLQPSYHYFEDKRCDYMLQGEFSANGFDNTIKMEQWTVAMAGDGEKYAHGCEFFITLTDETGRKLQGKFAPFGKVIDGFREIERIVNLPLVQVYPEGIGAVIKQPVEDEYMVDIEVETFGVEYTQPVIDHWPE